MKSTALKTFLLGATLGVGAMILCLYTRKPDRVASSIEAIAEMGRKRRVEEEEKVLQRERLKRMGFSDEELYEALNVALVVGGSIFIPHMRHAFESIEELRELEAAGELPDME